MVLIPVPLQDNIASGIAVAPSYQFLSRYVNFAGPIDDAHFQFLAVPAYQEDTVDFRGLHTVLLPNKVVRR
jgi:hypothetical protein